MLVSFPVSDSSIHVVVDASINVVVDASINVVVDATGMMRSATGSMSRTKRTGSFLVSLLQLSYQGATHTMAKPQRCS